MRIRMFLWPIKVPPQRMHSVLLRNGKPEYAGLTGILKAKPQLRLELPRSRDLVCRNLPKVGGIDVQIGIAQNGMIQDIPGIHADFHGFGLSDSHGLTGAHVEAETPGSCNPAFTEISESPGRRVLKQNTSLSIGNRAKRARGSRPLQRRGAGALRVGHEAISAGFEVHRQRCRHGGSSLILR